jgi:hypothetical protein
MGDVDLGSARLEVDDGLANGGTRFYCESLHPGDVDTLITTTGTLTGTFDDIPNGTVIPLECFQHNIPAVRIEYTASSVTATVVEPTITSVAVSNPSPATGEPVAYTATVAPGLRKEGQPSGAVEFLDSGQPFKQCSAQPLNPSGPSSSVATCELSYSTSGSHDITATYLGSQEDEQSSSGPQSVTVRGPPGLANQVPKAEILSKDALIKDRRWTKLAIRCIGESGTVCIGSISLTPPVAPNVYPKSYGGRHRFILAAGSVPAILVHLAPFVLVRLGEQHRLRARVSIRVEHGLFSEKEIGLLWSPSSHRR